MSTSMKSRFVHATAALAWLALLPSTAWAAPGPIAVWIATAFFVGAVLAAVVLLLRDALFGDGDEARYDRHSSTRGAADDRHGA